MAAPGAMADEVTGTSCIWARAPARRGVRNLSRILVIRRERRAASADAAQGLAPEAERPQPIVTARLRRRGAHRIPDVFPCCAARAAGQ
jgi:hypothetical protein